MVNKLILLEPILWKDEIAIRNLTAPKIGDLYSSTNKR